MLPSRSLNDLSPELILCIADNLNVTSLGRLSQTNGGLNSTLHNTVTKTARKHAFASKEEYDNCILIDPPSGIASLDYNWSFYLPDEPIVRAIERDNVDAVKGYLDAGIDPNVYTITGHRLLYTAAQNNAHGVSQLLLEYGADPNMQNLCSSNTPLLMSAACGDDANVRRLIFAGADVKIANVVHALCQACSLDSLKLALARGADVYQPSTRGISVFHDAVLNKSTDVLRYLVKTVPDLINDTDAHNQTPLWAASAAENHPALRILIDGGIDISHRNNHNETILHDMLYWLTETDIPRMLLDRGIEVNFAGQDMYTELHYAAEYGCVGIVGGLLERGLDPNAHDDQSQTPLHCAAKRNFLGVARVLVEEGGAVLNHVDALGRTPIDVARMRAAFDTWFYLEAMLKESMMPW